MVEGLVRMKFLNKLNPKRLMGSTWGREKAKAAVVLKGFSPLVNQSITVFYKRNFYRHIDKALKGKSTERDHKHWKKIHKSISKNIVGTPTPRTTQILAWLNEFKERVKRQEITKADMESLQDFKEYMQVQQKDELNNFILKNKLMEVPE